MIDKIREIFADGFNADTILAAIKLVLTTVFGFIAKEEGYEYPEVDA